MCKDTRMREEEEVEIRKAEVRHNEVYMSYVLKSDGVLGIRFML